MRILLALALAFSLASCALDSDDAAQSTCLPSCDHDLGFVIDGLCEPSCGTVTTCPEGTAPLSFVDDCLGLDAKQCVCAPTVK